MLKIFFVARWAQRLGLPYVPRLLYGLNRILFAVVLPPTVEIGSNVLFGYSGLGIVVHARSRIGSNVVIGTNVTIGGRSGHEAVPVIEDGVEIGSGAKILGPIVVGAGAKIGANAVVTTSVPPGATVVGIPGRVLTKKVDPDATGGRRE